VICKTCGKEFLIDWRKGKNSRNPPEYCSNFCSHSRRQTEEINERRAEKLKIKRDPVFCESCGKERSLGRNRGTAPKTGVCKECSTLSLEKIKSSTKKVNGKILRRLLLEKRKQLFCEECKIPEIYNGKPFTMETHHKDGDNTNNKEENLQVLCPTCHSQTITFRGRNIKNKQGRMVKGKQVEPAPLKGDNLEGSNPSPAKEIRGVI